MKRHKSGFTIVELLIVIVVIGILAAITIVAYNGIQNKAHLSSVQSDLSSAITKLEQYRYQTSSSEQYPTTLGASGLIASAGNNYTYTYVSSDNSYCLISSYGSTTYFVSSASRTPTPGICGDDGIIARYDFNGNTNDASGNSYNGTNNGAILATGQGGLANGSYVFNGTTQNITIPSTYGLSNKNLALSTWAYNPTSGNKGMFAKVGSLGNGVAIGMGASNMSTSGTNLLFLFEGSRWIYTGVAFATGWHQTAISIDDSGVPSLYLDGTLLGRPTGLSAITPITSSVIGGTTYGAEDRYFNGQVDDTHIYKRALSDAEVKSLFATGAQ